MKSVSGCSNIIYQQDGETIRDKIILHLKGSLHIRTSHRIIGDLRLTHGVANPYENLFRVRDAAYSRCFLSDEEVNRIAKHVKEANPSTYDPDILEKLDEIANGGETGNADIIINSSDMSGGDGGLFEQAVEFAIQDGQISTSTLQRRLKIGYARAGRLTDEMEERGIVAAKDGSKPRKCLITREEWEEMKKATEGMT